jgi:signal transduction histidine kinase
MSGPGPERIGARLASRLSGLRLRLKLGFVAAAATTAVLATTAYFTIRLFRTSMNDVLIEASSSHSDELRAILEEEMAENDLGGIRRLIAEVARSPSITWVAVLDGAGRVRMTSNPAAMDRVIDVASEECRGCHDGRRGERRRSITVSRGAGDVLRTVTPILNRAECHRCHGAEKRLNGILVVDRSLATVQQGLASSRAQVVAGSAAAVFALLASLGLAVERLVLTRLRRLRAAARELGHGNLAARAVDPSPDELGAVASDFNTMAEALAAALSSLGAERRQLDQIVNGISDGVVLVDRRLRVVATNRAFDARLPPGIHPLPGAAWVELAREAGFDGAEAVAERALANDRLEKVIVRQEGPAGERSEEIYAQPLHAADGAVTGAIEVWRDVTDRVALEAGLEQSERLAAIGLLASGVAHEVGNPLAAIATAVEGLLRRMDGPAGGDPGEVREYLEIVRRQVFRCREVTERLLGVARLPSTELAPVDVTRPAREVLALVGAQARAQGVDLRGELDGPAVALAEELLLGQVFLNLVLNGLQSMPAGGVLTVSAHAAADAVTVTVTDTGQGIPDAIRKTLFQPFRRARPNGTGLGLFLSEALVRRCDGTLAVESAPGRGATFTVRLRPAAGAGARPPAADGS